MIIGKGIMGNNYDRRVELLKEVALQAGENIKKNVMGKLKVKTGPQDFVTDIDKKNEITIIREIKNCFSSDNILSEELGHLTYSPESGGYLWVIDPLDGTNNFIRRRNLSAVSVALTKEGEILAGVVFNPFIGEKGELFFAQKDKGAFLNGQRVFCSKKRNIEEALFATDNYHDQHTLRCNIKILLNVSAPIRLTITGSAVLQMCEVAVGRVDLYLHTKLKPWDNAAAFLIAQEGGAKVINLKGEPVNFYSEEVVVVANPDLLDTFIAAINENKEI